jgi:hypothetical protein
MQVRVLYWQEIPSLIRVTLDDGTQQSRQLPDWFQQEIDRRAMAQGLVGSDAYLEAWNWSAPLERPEEPDALVEAIAAEFRASA